METSVLILALTFSLILVLRRELMSAFRDPTPARSLALISTAYMVGAALVQWRERNELATFVYSAYTLHFAMYLIGFFCLSKAMRLQLDPQHSNASAPNTAWPTATKWGFLLFALGGTTLAGFAVGANRVR